MGRKRKYRALWAALLLLGAIVLGAPLRAESVEEVVNPRRASGGFVSDGAGILGPEYVKLIDGVCRDLQAKTTVELAVATVGDLGGLPIEEFAEEVFRRFGIGAAGKDNGLLLLCSRDERAVRLEVGYGLEGAIPDALASRLLDDNGLPYLHQGLFGRGLFLSVREIARTAAAADGVALNAAEPSPWPEQIAPPAPPARPLAKKKAAWDPLLSSLYFAAGLLLLGALGILWTLLRLKRAKALAARRKAIGGGKVFTIMIWVLALAGFFLLLGFSGEFLLPLAAMLATPALATGGQLLAGSFLKRRLASYRIACAKCGAAMELVPDDQDDKLLSEEEAAEEKAGGMDYEIWRCPQCHAEERLAVKMGRASACPKCRRRTLTSSNSTLVQATREQEGRVRVTEACLNPACGYSKTSERSTPKLSSPSPSSSGSSPSSSGSFGGGRSGGGGASKNF